MGAKPPPKMGGLEAPHLRWGDWGQSPHLGINSFCDRFSYGFCGFSCISQPTVYTPPKTPSFPTGPASLLVVLRGFPHFIDTRA